MSDSNSYSLFPKGSRWYIQYTDAQGNRKQKSTGCRKKTDALKVLSDFKELTSSAPHSRSFSSFKDEFLVYAEGTFAEKTVRIYKASMNNFQRIIGDLPLVSISTAHSDLYKVKRQKDDRRSRIRPRKTTHLSPISINIELRSLKAAFNTALRWKYITENPFVGQSLLFVPDATPTFFSREDFQKMLDGIKEDWLKEIIVFAVLTGLRRGEIGHLRWEDVDLERRLVVIRSSENHKTKAGKIRTIPLSDGAAYILDERKKYTRSEYVFKQYSDDYASHKFKMYIKSIKGSEEKLHFHSLRHTFASWLVQSGTDIYAVRQLLGHSDVKTTMVYAHLLPQKMHDTVNRITLNLN
jgi:integrase